MSALLVIRIQVKVPEQCTRFLNEKSGFSGKNDNSATKSFRSWPVDFKTRHCPATWRQAGHERGRSPPCEVRVSAFRERDSLVLYATYLHVKYQKRVALNSTRSRKRVKKTEPQKWQSRTPHKGPESLPKPDPLLQEDFN